MSTKQPDILAPQTAEQISNEPAASLKILIVDDSPEDRMVVRFALETGGYTIKEAENGRMGLAATEAFKPDCILLDYRLPDMDGVEVLDALRSSAGAMPFAIVILTGLSDAATATKLLQAGAHDYLSKSHLNTDSLSRAIQVGVDRFQMLRRQRELQERNAQLAAIVTASGDAILRVGLDLVVQSWNPGAAAMFGYREDEAIGRSLNDLIAPSELGEQPELYRETVVEQKAVFVEATLRRKDGGLLAVENSAAPILDPDGKTIAISVVLRDVSGRKRAEEEIRRLNADLERRVAERTAEVEAKEYFLRMITDAAPGLLSYWDANLRNRFANRRYLDWLGKTPEEISGLHMADVLGSTLFAEIESHVRAVLSGEPQRFEHLVIRPDGSERCTLTHYVPDLVDGTAHGFVIEVSDITEFKQAQAELAKQANEYEDLYNNAPCGYHSLDGDGTIIKINDTELAWLGLRREEVVGKRRITEFMTEASQRTFRQNFPKFLAAGRIDELEFEFLTAEGGLMPVIVSATALRHPTGAFESSRSVVLDSSRLRVEQETLRQVMKASPMAVRVARLSDNKLLFMNRAFTDLVQRTEEEAARLDIRSCYCDPAVFDDIAACLARGEIVMNRLVQLHLVDHPEIPPVWALASFMTIFYEGQPASLAWLYDVTALHDAKLAAEHAMAARAQFLANMSHEIRTPMNAILGFTKLLEREDPMPAQVDRLGKIDVAARHLLVLIDDILDLSRIEAGGLKLEERAFNLGQLFADVCSLISSAARAKGLRLNIDIDRLPEHVSGDVTRLRQALLNYANNALKFTNKGFITLRASQIVEDEGSILARFEVEDSGIGIAPEVLPRLFCMFEQADASIKRRFGGTGLGLAITRRLAEAMGGQAGANSEPGFGSTFWFTARLNKSVSASEQGAHGASEAVVAHYGGRKDARILLVEDNEINREVAVELLRAVGLHVLAAENGMQALEKAQAEPIDLILMDVQMPVMDGMEATREIRRLPGWKTKPIVALTANAFSEDRRACLDAGMNDFVTKPIDPGHLYATLARCLPKASEIEDAMSVRITPKNIGILEIDGLDVADGARRMSGDAEAFRCLIRRFAEVHRGDVDQIRERLSHGDADGAKLIAHSLRGAAGNIGAKDLCAAAARLEGVISSWDGGAIVEQVLAATEVKLASLLASILSSIPPQSAVRQEQYGAEPETWRRILNELEAALAASDVQANKILNSSDLVLRSSLGNAYEPLRRQIADYQFPQALKTLRNLRKK